MCGLLWVLPQVLPDASERLPSLGEGRSFSREVAILVAARHPNICALLGTSMHKGRPCLVMEYKDGGNLLQLLAAAAKGRGRSKEASVATRVRVAHEVAEGLACLHSHGILHSDLKATNVLLDKQLRAYISDIGVGAWFPRPCDKIDVRYMAPEVIKGEPHGAKADVYSFGMLLWHIMHRRVPFADQALDRISFQVAVEQRRPDLSLPPELEPFGFLITVCCAQEEINRPNMSRVVEQFHALRLAGAAPPPEKGRTLSAGQKRADCSPKEPTADGF